MTNVEPKESSTLVGSGNEKSQSLSMGKIGFDYVDQMQFPPKMTIATTCEKVAKETPPNKLTPSPLIVEREDWVILQPKASPMKRLFK
jgi:hypothetical protein